MKKQVLFAGIAVAISAQITNAQTWNATDGNKLTALSDSANHNVNVGIGTAADSSNRLSVSGATKFVGSSAFDVSGKHLQITTSDKSTLYIDNESSNSKQNNIIASVGQNGNTGLSFAASNFNFKDGNVNIAQGLDVKGKITCYEEIEVTDIMAKNIKAKDISVEMDHAADYVFADDYNLKSLNELENYVKTNRHLPGMPSAQEMSENGMSLSEMSNKLLEKVEELTLHLIRLEKENQRLKQRIEDLEK